ncbi:2,3-bisphosphoglycerate-independent phosphoglycerate mutase [Marivirga sp. S37H4]|uniref:2,3-bisphosphoglycerate-independent phosphoglycerate mutase n=1 Tax=Marivirga aurantiaca TaxID=2802615 RepID=A0A935C9F9_9BACT|nr:2,3-bisphosphoglycerate-independent phosphoglycerate mutase [Marivirga aurantiaca]MBK6265572.1 2,3-bisphosphoglycerate-independent phosphoglycerate mutase [Marivirga aurantiaca]
MENNKKALLMILDGWGITAEGDEEISAIAQAKTPFMDKVWQEKPHSQLKTHGIAVGLPEGQMGNSEVGHMNLGAGRVVYQELVKINLAIEDRNLHKNKILLDALDYANIQDKRVHIMGLVSDGGIHSHIDHLKALCTIAGEQEISKLYVHVFTDGRDTDPKSGMGYIEELQQHLQNTTGRIATIMGRYYAMDRGKNWDRTAKAYHAMVKGKAETMVPADQWKQAIQEKYKKEETDEFLKPIVMTDKDLPLTTIREGDVVINFNYRTDRARQITQALTQEDYRDQDMKKLNLQYLAMTQYDKTYKNISILFESGEMKDTMGEVLAKNGKKQIRIAETIKYPHVTYFFNNGREDAFEGEERIMIDSPDVPTFDEKPEMSAKGIRDAIIPKIKDKEADFICLNFANPDMVGHTGKIDAAIKACETVDACTQAVVESALENEYAVIIIADHGNAEKMKNPDGTPFTAHTVNPVPCILLGVDDEMKLQNGKLSDIAPTILTIMGIEQPEEMSGNVLLEMQSTPK